MSLANRSAPNRERAPFPLPLNNELQMSDLEDKLQQTSFLDSVVWQTNICIYIYISLYPILCYCVPFSLTWQIFFQSYNYVTCSNYCVTCSNYNNIMKIEIGHWHPDGRKIERNNNNSSTNSKTYESLARRIADTFRLSFTFLYITARDSHPESKTTLLDICTCQTERFLSVFIPTSSHLLTKNNGFTPILYIIDSSRFRIWVVLVVQRLTVQLGTS